MRFTERPSEPSGEVVERLPGLPADDVGVVPGVILRVPEHRASPLLELPNAVLTPHIGSASEATRARMVELAVKNLLAALAGQRMPQCANPAVYTRPIS